jgi:hypothetical protein
VLCQQLGLFGENLVAIDGSKFKAVNARLSVMCAHYLFDPHFCNFASGWEKGIVEKNVQDGRRLIWIWPPAFSGKEPLLLDRPSRTSPGWSARQRR